MFRKLAIVALILPVSLGQVAAQTWANGLRRVTYSNSPIIGDGVDRVPEIFTPTQGGDPPATLSEPTAIGEGG